MAARGAGRASGRAELLAADVRGVGRAAALLGQGALVAFPTETVYGLGALALDGAAVARVFAAKGRPASNPVIVHVLGLDEARAVCGEIPALAERLAAAFWPGPLTLVLPRGARVPDEVTAGGPTVAVRAPSHPVARALIAATGAPIAAPSANRSTEISPTRAAHVLASLGDRIAAVIDGGPCDRGIESTVVDITGAVPVVLRPGSIGRAAIEQAAGVAARGDEPVGGLGGEGAAPARSPGLMARHYAPRAELVVVDAERFTAHLAALLARGARAAGLGAGTAVPVGLTLARDAGAYARDLYDSLHTLDAVADVIVVERPPEGDAWEAVHDRLARASRRA